MTGNHLVALHLISSFDDAEFPDLVEFSQLKDVSLRLSSESDHGLYIAESAQVIRRALAAGHLPRALLMAPRWLESMADVIADLGPDVPVYIADEPLLESITGFNVHRGPLASMHRPPLTDFRDIVRNRPDGSPVTRVVVLDDLVDHTNVGAVFRSCAAMGVDAILLSPRCADPLYRRSVRVSMGTVFQVPWARLAHWPTAQRGAADIDGIDVLKEYGFTVAALALTDDSVSLDAIEVETPEKLVLVLGNEGHGLGSRTVANCDVTIKIPMSGVVDSLNAAAAAAVAIWATRVRPTNLPQNRV